MFLLYHLSEIYVDLAISTADFSRFYMCFFCFNGFYLSCSFKLYYISYLHVVFRWCVVTFYVFVCRIFLCLNHFLLATVKVLCYFVVNPGCHFNCIVSCIFLMSNNLLTYLITDLLVCFGKGVLCSLWPTQAEMFIIDAYRVKTMRADKIN